MPRPASATLSEDVRRLLDGPNLAHLATLIPDGSPQVSPVWVDRDGDQILANTAEGRLKARNIRRDPRVALSLTDSQNAHSRLLVRGRVVDVTTEGAGEHIDRMAQK